MFNDYLEVICSFEVDRMENSQACVWTTHKALWDNFLNDPELTRAIEQLRVDQLREENQHYGAVDDGGKPAASAQAPIPKSSGDEQTEEKERQQIGDRLKAYETPITDDILRQSIR